jgi:hypothetical protein
MTGRIGYPRLRGPSASQVVLDGELVAVRPDGVTSFPTLQAALSAARSDRQDVYNTTTLSCGCSSTDRAVNLTNRGDSNAGSLDCTIATAPATH